MKYFLLGLILLSIASCKKELPSEPYDLKGSWYTDTKDGYGSSDKVSDYFEMYVSDTAIFFQMETSGTAIRKYYIQEDSMYQCAGLRNAPCQFLPMYKINRYYQDTLWLTSPKKYTIGDTSTYWVRFPKDELGPNELNWTAENEDSLRIKVMYDYLRRTVKFYDIVHGKKSHYDSLLKAGEWNWTMKSIREKQKRDSIANLQQ